MQPPASSPSPLPNNNDDPRGEEFDISTLPTSSSAGSGNRKLIPTQWNRSWLLVAAFLAAWSIYMFSYSLGARSQKPLPLPINTPSATPAAISTVTVHVAGAVVRPGVYSVSANARISDAIAQAGGLTPDAETTTLNLADFVRDGSQIVVPARAITNANPPSDLTSPNGLPDTTPTTASDAAKAAQIAYLRAHPIDLNLASSFELQQLPGIGPAMADEIIAYRIANGLFRSVSDLDNVKGIGEKRMETLKDLVVVR